ncbi:hypothetical protein AB0A73_18565 [Glycomyces sp. NPDC047369]
MNEQDVQQLLARAASGPVHADDVDPLAILAAGRRDVLRRKRTAAAVAGGAVVVLGLAAAVGIPLMLGGDDPIAPGGAAPPDLPALAADAGFPEQLARFDRGDCPLPDGQSEEQRRTAAAYNEALYAGLAELGAAPAGGCLTTRPDYDGFYYSDDQGLYMLEESLAFGGTASDRAEMSAAVWETGGVDYEDQMEDEECTYNEGLTCSWDDTPEGRVLLMEGVRSDFTDPDTESGGSADYPTVGAFLFRDDDVVVSLTLSLRFSSDRDLPSLDQVVALVSSIPVGQEAPELEQPTVDTLTAALADAVEANAPGAVVDTGTAALFRLHPDVATYGGPVYGSEATHMLFVTAELPSGETVRFYLQAERVDEPGDDPEAAAAAAAQCGDAACETGTDESGTVTVHRTIEDGRPGLTSLAYSPVDGWLLGVGVETADSTEAPPVDFAALDAILDEVR